MSTTERQEHYERADGGLVWRVPEELRLRLLAALSAPPEQRPPLSMTYEEFLDWLDEDTAAEWVNGEIVMPSPVSFRHQRVANFLMMLLLNYAEEQNLGVVCSAPFQMKLADSGREPDVLFIANEHRSRLKPTYLDGPADVAIDVVSPESVGRDRGEKFYEYERAGIPEY